MDGENNLNERLEEIDSEENQVEIPTDISSDSENVEIEGVAEGQAPSGDDVAETSENGETAESGESVNVESGETSTNENAENSVSDAEGNAEAEGPSEDSGEGEKPVEQPDFPPKVYADSYYLLFGKKELSDSLDLAGTKSFLDGLGFAGGELSQARNEKKKASTFKQREEEDCELICSYCGLKISGVDYYRLSDGRCRCTMCSRSLVKNIEQLEDIFNRIVKDMEILFDALITKDIQIEMTDEKTIKKRCKLSIGDIDNTDLMIFGVAIKDKKGYKVCIENSLPRIRVIATLAHELTHIWQYENWDKGVKAKKRKCIFRRRKKGNMLSAKRPLTDYEGMAKWVEIQYLYLIGETKMAMREEVITRHRKDEYGYGFAKYEKLYPLQKKVMTKGKSPFSRKDEKED